MKKYSIMKLLITIFISLVVFTSCNSGNNSRKDNKGTLKESTPAAEVTSPIEPVTATQAQVPKCFQNDGLKYRTIIQLNYLSPTDVAGTVSVDEYSNKLTDKQRFSGTIKGNEITVKFMSKPPEAGSSSEWTNKPWTIITTDSVEVLKIIFNAKNFETNQWAETAYEFKSCANK